MPEEKSLDLSVALQRAQEIIKKYKAKELSLIQFVQEIVRLVEDYAKEVQAEVEAGKVSGKDKKKIAVSIINAAVDIPLLPEGIEEMIISFLVDWVVDLLNKTGWVKL